MGFANEFKNGRRNSFEDNNRSLDSFRYMNGSFQPNDKEILIYRRNHESQSNERVWIKRGSIDISG